MKIKGANAVLWTAVLRCLAALSRKDREVLVLMDVQGFSEEEIAFILEIAPGTVKSRRHRARKKLRGWLADNGFPHDDDVDDEEV